MDKQLTVSASPHLRNQASTTRIMLDVLLALLPTTIAATVIFGTRVLFVCLVTIGSCVLSEYVARKVMKRSNTLTDLSAIVTGLILALNLPVSIPLWMAAFGGIVAIVVAKQMFGGLGQNFINPAIAGRIVLTASFPTAMTNFTQPVTSGYADAVSAASPLSVLNKGGTAQLPSMLDMLLGNHMGSLGEVCSIALLLGFGYLVIRKVVIPIIPLCYIGTVALIMLIAHPGDWAFLGYQILGGGLLLGAFFMATDYATSPLTIKGKIIFGIGCGLITCLIRLYASMPEGVSFSIIIMNIFVPHIDRLTLPKPFGAQKEKKKRSEAEA